MTSDHLSRRGLLDLEPDLARELSASDLTDARRWLTLPALTFDAGAGLELERLKTRADVQPPLIGIWVARGGLVMTLDVAERRCSRVLVKGELLLLDGVEADSVPSRWRWSTLPGTELVLLDARVVAVGRRFPSLLVAILARGALQARRAFQQQAYSQLPRVEHRILTLMWSLADRIGHTRAEGATVELALTHAVIGEMLGARRPTVSLGLRKLERMGWLRREGDTWQLDRASLSAFSAAPEAGQD